MLQAMNQLKERWMLQAMEQETIEGAMVDARYEYGSN
jgi:inhibitor of KinA sporulation pathway (predicted exonuclease)